MVAVQVMGNDTAIGIAAWNTALISAGYLFSDRILTLVM